MHPVTLIASFIISFVSRTPFSSACEVYPLTKEGHLHTSANAYRVFYICGTMGHLRLYLHFHPHFYYRFNLPTHHNHRHRLFASVIDIVFIVFIIAAVVVKVTLAASTSITLTLNGVLVLNMGLHMGCR